MDEKEQAGRSPADEIYGVMLPGSKMAKVLDILRPVVGIEGYKEIVRAELEKQGLQEHIGEVLMRAEEME